MTACADRKLVFTKIVLFKLIHFSGVLPGAAADPSIEFINNSVKIEGFSFSSTANNSMFSFKKLNWKDALNLMCSN